MRWEANDHSDTILFEYNLQNKICKQNSYSHYPQFTFNSILKWNSTMIRWIDIKFYHPNCKITMTKYQIVSKLQCKEKSYVWWIQMSMRIRKTLRIFYAYVLSISLQASCIVKTKSNSIQFADHISKQFLFDQKKKRKYKTELQNDFKL